MNLNWTEIKPKPRKGLTVPLHFSEVSHTSLLQTVQKSLTFGNIPPSLYLPNSSRPSVEALGEIGHFLQRWEMRMARQQKPSSWMNNPQPQSYSMSVQIGIRATRNTLSHSERHQRANATLLNLRLNVLCRLLVCSADIFSTISSIIQFVCELSHKHLRSPGFFGSFHNALDTVWG